MATIFGIKLPWADASSDASRKGRATSRTTSNNKASDRSATGRPAPKKMPTVLMPGAPATSTSTTAMPQFTSNVVANDGLEQDFDWTDLEENPRNVHHWKRLRRPSTTNDRRVNEAAMQWLAKLPAKLRPLHTGRDYPHVVNELARIWDEREELTIYFENLLFSRRKKRAGFPPASKAEIIALAELAKQEGRIS